MPGTGHVISIPRQERSLALVLAHLTPGGTTTAQVCLYFMYIYTFIYIYTHKKHSYQYSDKYTDIGSEILHATHTAI